jgi:DNA invertase Pin-like site-specific DNA recombinase
VRPVVPNRARPGLREALAACRAGDTLVVTKLDRPARSVPDARAIADELTAGEIKLSIGGSVHDPTDPVGRLVFDALAVVVEFEADLVRMRTREGMKAGLPVPSRALAPRAADRARRYLAHFGSAWGAPGQQVPAAAPARR